MEETQTMTNPITIQNQHQLWPLKVAFNHQTNPDNNRQKRKKEKKGNIGFIMKDLPPKRK